MDGTVYRGDEPIPGAAGFVAALADGGIPYVFLTNNSSRGVGHYLRKLRGMGISAAKENVLTSATATFRYLDSHEKGSRVMLLGTPEFEAEAREAGIDAVDTDPDVVLLSFDRTITYAKINAAYRALRAGARFVATHPDDLCPAEDGYDIDVGPFIRMLESMTGAKATVVGKPNPLMLEMAAGAMGVAPRDVVMVGDRLYTDIRMAAEAGNESFLVLTGEATEGDAAVSEWKPTHVVGSVADIAPYLGL
ncbi:MAG: HAD-IIA family hydrolase [Thermoplasmatales archaeon]|nr:HAD-IIA family hydrolase [Thermoplasmatales archaeon]